ncbi:hypothetical protein EYF80_031631 [Liparis tanakae]|uniref:Uncharacterized protein n=1 Tax=Liparis tanakae TaxID=230148 RepID=A0A4Z2GWZ6_9TELE|nr:hypothetical protein EYF80_031631 [Liparis tanakae]
MAARRMRAELSSAADVWRRAAEFTSRRAGSGALTSGAEREKRPAVYSLQDAQGSEEILPQSVNSNRYKNAKKHYKGSRSTQESSPSSPFKWQNTLPTAFTVLQ